jgi:hypothetical protein
MTATTARADAGRVWPLAATLTPAGELVRPHRRLQSEPFGEGLELGGDRVNVVPGGSRRQEPRPRTCRVRPFRVTPSRSVLMIRQPADG